MKKPIAYGAVRVLRGRHAGRVGYYDDDDGDDGERAVVYFREPFLEEPTLVPTRDLAPVDLKLLDLERWKRKHPWIARQMGIS